MQTKPGVLVEKLKAVIVDDKPEVVEALKVILHQYCSHEVDILESFLCPQEAYEKMHQTRFDLIFLDIEMPGMDGFQLLYRLRKHQNLEVIFISRYGEQAIQAFKVSAVDFIKKPFVPQDVVEAVRKIEEKKAIQFQLNYLHTLLQNPELHILEQKMTITSRYGYLYVPFGDILYCQGLGNKTRYHIKGDTQIVETRVLREVSLLLPPNFFYRIHRSFVVNREYIKEYSRRDGHHIRLNNEQNTRLDIAQSRLQDFLLWLN